MNQLIHIKIGLDVEDFLAHLTVAAYNIALRYKVNGSFLEMEMGIWKALREVIQEDMDSSKEIFHNFTQKNRVAQKRISQSVPMNLKNFGEI